MKDPKEYAKELVDKYYQVQEQPEWGNEELKKEAEITYANNFVEFEKYYRGLAIECALLTVQYVINANPHSNPLNTEVHSTMGFWEKVKTEIINLK